MANRDRPDMDILTEAMEGSNIGDGGTGSEQLLFNPRPGGIAAQSLKDIPRYLFRVVAPKSDGDTNGTWARSESASTRDVFSFLGRKDWKTKAVELNVHLRWYGHRYDTKDNFVSWTSSLLFAIQYIYYRRFSDDDEPSLNDIKLYVIDTTLFPIRTFMRDLDLIRSFCGFDNNNDPPDYWNLSSLYTLRTKKGHYFGEYLSQGSLKIENKFQMIPANILFENNRLRRLQPEFAGLYNGPPRGEKPKWAAAVVDLRRKIWPETTPLLSLAEMHNRLQAVKEIVDNVAPGWRFPLGIYLTTLIGPMSEIERQPFATENLFFKYLRSGTSDDEHPGVEPFLFNVIARGSPEIPEQKQVQALVREIYTHFHLTQALDYVDKIKRNIRCLNENDLLRKNEAATTTIAELTERLANAGQDVFSRLSTA